MNAVKAFEAAARHESLTRAASELHVTHGAVSRQVALLEGWCGIALFTRSASRLKLTSAGAAYFREVEAILDRLALASMDMRNEAPPVALKVNAPPTFTMKWLLRHISGFQRNHPGVEIRPTTSLDPIVAHDNSFDIAIRADHPRQGVLPGWNSVPIMTEWIAPICHPEIVCRNSGSMLDDLQTMRPLTYLTQPYTWSDWLRTAGEVSASIEETQRFEQMYFALAAVQEKLGIALLPVYLVIEELVRGDLCLPFGMLGAQSRRCQVYYRADGEQSGLAAALADCLRDEGAATERVMHDWIATTHIAE